MHNSLGDLWKWAGGIVPLVLAFSLSNDSAYAEPAFDPAIDVQLFDMSPGPRSFMGVADGTTEEKGQYSMDLLLTFLTDPFVIYNVNPTDDTIEDTRTDVVSSLFAGQLTGAYGLTKGLHLGVSLPLVFSMRGDGIDPASGDMATGGLQATGLGDLRIEGKGRILRNASMGAAWTVGLTVPTSFGAGGNDYLGDDLPSARGGVAAHFDVADGMLRLGANVGAIFRKPRKIYASEVGQQVTYGAGAAFRVTDGFSLIGEAFGRTALTAIALDASPLEVGGGMRIQATESLSVLAGGGAGVVSGIGSPALRFLVSVGYAPDLGDSDGDGVPNMRDACPLIKEDFDEFEDSDGCPENDNDGDRREDAIDQCPNDKEDIDGFEDEDGCPEADNDGDKILDADDRCPEDPEDGRSPYSTDGCPADKRDSDDDGVSDLTDACPDDYEDEDGFEDWDGCPEPDNDHDGIPDDDDACPLCPEDIDGFEDTDGCPEFDNDRDGIADRSDSCPDKAETINDNEDEDGCPDNGPELATLEGNRLVLIEEPRFTSTDTLRNRRMLASVARIMRMNRDVTLWRVVVAARNQATDDETRAKSQTRADAIRDALIRGGVAEGNIEAIGAVSPNVIVAIAAVERSDGEQEFFCPASMEAQERPEPEPEDVPAPVMAPAMAPEISVPESAPSAPVLKALPKVVATGATAELPGEMQGSQGVDPALRLKRGKAAFAGKTTKKRLDVLASMLNNNPGTRLEFLVHTDGNKGKAGSLTISAAQAQFLVDYIVKAGIGATRVGAVGKGMSQPLGDNKSSKGREKNRRVEVRFSLLK